VDSGDGGARAREHDPRQSARHLRLDALEVVNFMGKVHSPAEGSIEAPLTILA
jgi:hypothetical protein